MKEIYKDILIVILTLALLLLGSYVIIDNIHNNYDNTKDTQYKDNNSNLNSIEENNQSNHSIINNNKSQYFNSNYSINNTQYKDNNSNLNNIEKDNQSNYGNITYNRYLFFNSTNKKNKESKDNLTNNESLLNNSNITLNNHETHNSTNSTTNYITNYSNPLKNYNYPIKNVPISELFMNLKYSNVLPISDEQGQGIIKTYKNENTINFDIRTYKPNLDNPEYVTVSKEILHFKYGTYYKYTYTPKYTNTTESYCYYRKIGKYHIIMGFKKEDKHIRDMWLRWNEHINNVLFEN